MKFQGRSCGYFKWHDEPLNERVKDLINELKWENRKLSVENRQLKSMVTGENSANDEVAAEIDDLWVELSRLKKATVDKDEYSMIRKRLILAYVVISISWLVLLMCFMML